jgi:tRNA threonylcarbamoyladenosine biosynthesis protein TsaE
MPRSINLSNLDATDALGAHIAARLRPGDAVLLAGPYGAGKTALARALLRSLTGDPTLEVPSPSYTLVQAYETPIGPVHHFDLWRLDGPEAVTELGWDEAREGVVLAEWPERLGALRPPEALEIALEVALAPDSPESNGEGTGARRAVLSGWPEERL